MALKNLLPLLNVSDIEASLEFYRDAFDFAVVSDPDDVTRLYAQVIAREFEPGALQDTEQADSEQRL